MVKWIYFIAILSFAQHTWGQIKFDVKVSDRHIKKLEKTKGSRSKLDSYQKFYSQDSTKAAKRAWVQYKKENRDSLRAEGLWKEARANKHKILSNRWDSYSELAFYRVDTRSFPKPKDSLDWAFQELARQGNFEELQTVYAAYAQYDSAYLDQFHPDSISIDSLLLSDRFEMKERIATYLPNELAKETDLDVAKRIEAGTIDEYGEIKKIDRSGVKDFFQNVSPDQFARSQLSITTLKKKYATLPSLEKKNEGIKRKSLKGTPWKQRMFLSGNFTIQSTAPLIIDSDIKTGFKFNKPFSIGIGFVLREQFKNSMTTLTGDAHGYSFFSSYEILSSFFLYGEYQAIKNKSLFQESIIPIKWQNAYMLGGGREFKFTRSMSVSVSMLYDFNYKKNDLNSRPLVFRFGYKIEF